MRDTANRHSLELCASIVLLFLDGCSEWYDSVVFLTGQVLGNWIASGSWPDKGNSQCLVMGICSSLGIPKDFSTIPVLKTSSQTQQKLTDDWNASAVGKQLKALTCTVTAYCAHHWGEIIPGTGEVANEDNK